MVVNTRSRDDVPEVAGPGEDREPRRTGIADGNLAQPIELDDFFEGLAFVFQLPRRQRAVAPRANVADRTTTAPTRPAWWVPVALAAVLGVGGFVVLQSRGARDDIPVAAMGQWVTTDSRYADRAFDLDSTQVVFHAGQGRKAADHHAIEAVRVRADGRRKRVNVTYRAEGSPMDFSFWLENDTATVIRFVNQPDIAWTRAATP
jgi:hypothetical protein